MPTAKADTAHAADHPTGPAIDQVTGAPLVAASDLLFEQVARVLAARATGARSPNPIRRRASRLASPVERLASDRIGVYLTAGDPQARLVQLVITGATRVADLYRAHYPAPERDLAWQLDPAARGGQEPTGPARLSVELARAALTAPTREEVAAGVLEVLAGRDPGEVLAGVVELAATYGVMLRATHQ